MFNLFKKRNIDFSDTSIPLGKRGELVAQDMYHKQGYKIIAANEFNHKGKQAGEIDFVARDDMRIIFVEVKTRADEHGYHGTAVESVNYFKQRKLLKAVKLFLVRNKHYQQLQPKIDVCVVLMGQLDIKPKNVTIISNAVEDTN